MSEKLVPSFLEPFRDSRYPFLYKVGDVQAAKAVIQTYEHRPYGIELGFGMEPTRVFHIDTHIPWILAEPDEDSFKFFDTTDKFRDPWSDLDKNTLHPTEPIIAIKLPLFYQFHQHAHTAVYRNLNYQDMWMIPFDQIQKGQRVVFIVNRHHVREMHEYTKYLSNFGYDPTLLRLRPRELPPLTNPHPYIHTSYMPEYVLDVRK